MPIYPKSTTRHTGAKQVLKQMRQLLTAIRGRLDEELRPEGVTMPQVQALFHIRQVKACTGAQLARALSVTPQTMQSLLARAEREGWIRRGRDATNERLVLWSLTKAGEGLLGRAEIAFEALQESLWRGFTTTSIRELSTNLERCLGNLKE